MYLLFPHMSTEGCLNFTSWKFKCYIFFLRDRLTKNGRCSVFKGCRFSNTLTGSWSWLFKSVDNKGLLVLRGANIQSVIVCICLYKITVVQYMIKEFELLQNELAATHTSDRGWLKAVSYLQCSPVFTFKASSLKIKIIYLWHVKVWRPEENLIFLW